MNRSSIYISEGKVIHIGICKLVYFFVKRILDILIACLAVLIMAPLLIIIGILIKFSSEGPVFYIQKAIGKNGREFDFYKFRTMYKDTSNTQHKEYLQKFIKGDEVITYADGGEQIFKMVNDPRITPIGRILRKSSMDELPQLINVLKGDMSVVGPRPPLPYEYSLYDDYTKQKMVVKPGITGLYQITSRSRASFDEILALDFEYIEKMSLWYDLKIILMTIPAVLSSKGAY